MRYSNIATAALLVFSSGVQAQAVSLPLLTPGGPIGSVTASVFSALPPPLTTTAPLPVDLTVLENGANGSGYNQVLGLGGGHDTGTLIGPQLNNTLVTPLLGLPTGTAQPIDVAVLGGDGVGNSNAGGVAGVAVLSGHDVAHGGLVGLGVLNKNRTGQGRMLGVAALSGRDSGHASEGLGIGLLNRGETLGVSVGGTRVLTLANASSQVQGALPGLDQGGVAIGGGSPVASSNPLLNAGVLAGDHAGSGGLVGVAVLSGSQSANAQLVGVGVLNGAGSANAPIGVDVLSGSGSGVSADGLGVAVLSDGDSGKGGVLGAGVLTGDGSGVGGVIGAGVLSGEQSGQGGNLGLAALSGEGSGSGGSLGGNVAGSGGSSGGGTPSTPSNGLGNGATASPGGAYAYNSSDNSNARTAVSGHNVCKIGYKDANGRMVRPTQCDTAQRTLSKS